MGTPLNVGVLPAVRVASLALLVWFIGQLSLGAEPVDYVVLQAPGCVSTIPWGVNERGDVVGNGISCTGTSEDFAFLYRDGAYTAIDVPGAAITIPTDINERGVVIGYYRTPDGELGAFVYSRGEHQALSVPGVDLVPQGINNRGDITGWIPTVPYQAFLLTKDGEFTVLTVDEDVEGLQAWKINSSGVIVGGGFSPTLGPMSFVYRRGASSIAEVPGLYTAVNDRGDVAAEVPGSGFVVYRNGAPLTLNHPENGYTIFDLSNRWVVGALVDGRGYMLRLQ